MADVGSILNELKGYGGYSTSVILLIVWWKGLPPLIRLWNERADKMAEHTGREIDRLERQIEASDRRHEECMVGQRLLRQEIEEQRKVIDGLIRQMRQMQISTIRTVGVESETVTAKLIAELDRIPGEGH